MNATAIVFGNGPAAPRAEHHDLGRLRTPLPLLVPTAVPRAAAGTLATMALKCESGRIARSEDGGRSEAGCGDRAARAAHLDSARTFIGRMGFQPTGSTPASAARSVAQYATRTGLRPLARRPRRRRSRRRKRREEAGARRLGFAASPCSRSCAASRIQQLATLRSSLPHSLALPPCSAGWPIAAAITWNSAG